MALPTFNNFSLNDATYITETVEHRTRATRRLESEVISRRMGKKLTNTQIQEKVIEISGKILTPDTSSMQTAVDNLHQYVTDIEGDLAIESGRTWRATSERIRVPDRKYNQTVQDFEIQFVCVQPYATGDLQTLPFVIPSGVQTYTLSTTISGSAPSRPLFRFVLPSGSSVSPVVRVDLQYTQTGNIVTFSGAYTVGDTIILNYDRYLLTVNGTNDDFIGQIEDILPGDVSFLLTVSGRNDGTRASMEYNPRYY